MKRLLFAVLLIAFLAFWLIRDARAFDCIPNTSATPYASGGPLVVTRTPGGECDAWWCPGPLLPDGRTSWRVNKQCALNKYRKVAPDPLAIVGAILTAPDAVLAISAAASAATIAPAGAQEVYDFAFLNWANCQTMTKAVNLPPQATLLTNNCATMPTPPAASADIWRALGTSIYTTAAGKLVAPIAGARAAAAALCDATATPIVAGAVTYLPLVGAPATQVTSCKKASQ